MQMHVGQNLRPSSVPPDASVQQFETEKTKQIETEEKNFSKKNPQTPKQTKTKKFQFQLIFFHNQFFTLLNRPVLISSSLCFTERCAPFKQNQDTKKNTKNNDKQRQIHTFLFNFQTLYWKYFNKITSLAGLLYQYGGKTNKQRKKTL